MIGDVRDTNLAKLVWDEVASKIEIIDETGEAHRYRLLGIIADEINAEEKVTKIWDSELDKSGKATLIDRILIICPEESSPEPKIGNDEIIWNQTESISTRLN